MTTATATSSDTGVLATGSERDLGTWLDDLRSAWDKFLALRASIAELNALNDRQLADVGITRPAIRQHARTAVYGN